MSRLVKSKIMSELKSRYASLDSALWVELVGADGLVTNDFRRALHARKMRLEVVRNLLFRRVTDGTGLRRLGEALSGPAAIISGGDGLSEMAKVVEEWSPKIKGLKMRGAVLEGEFIAEKDCAKIATMPTKRDMQARVASAVRSPGARLASAIRAPGANIAGCLKALIEKLEKGGSGAAPAADAASA